MVESSQRRGGPLAGVRVLELGTMIAGPVAATLLGDFGAEVIKIEPPKGGDPIRQSGPFVGEESLYWNVEGRSKRSVTLDLRLPEGQRVLRELVRHVDVLVENFRPGTLAKWGLGYAQLRAINPSLVMLSISGFGQTGPYAGRPSYDRIALAFAGFLNMTGFPDRPPVRPGNATADYQSAILGAFAAMVALYYRDARGGVGQHIDLSLYESVFRFTDVMITAYDKLGTPRERQGNVHFAASPGDHYETRDGRYIALTVAANTVFQRLCESMGRPELADDPRYDAHIKRVANYAQINGIVADWIKSMPVEEVLARLEANSVPHSLIYKPSDILADPHYQARGSIASLEHPKIGSLKLPSIHPRFSASPAPEMQPAPALGEHTQRVLSEMLSMSPGEIDKLREAGVI
ncbi:CaiB/BaiF CoA transferase family protein [Steroidobacter flavus]|uniref:CaiB/BaiF CoA transferase family protein n=1 Tax=Steroidobacter flavus TaxID=1842136 RepID=A0ABV8SYT4_9GAMM